MRFLADESCDFAVVRALRSAGHDVIAIAEVSPRADDEIVIDRAVREDRILLPEDKDFGWVSGIGYLLFRGGVEPDYGLIGLNAPLKSRAPDARRLSPDTF